MRLDTGDQRVLFGGLGKVRLRHIGKQKLDEPFGPFAVVSVLYKAGACHEYQGPWVAASQKVVTGAELRSLLFQEPLKIVVIYEPNIHITPGHCGYSGCVVGVGLCLVGLNALKPVPGPLVRPI